MTTIKLNDPKLRKTNHSIKKEEYRTLPWDDMFNLCYNKKWEQIWVWVALPQVWINKTWFIVNYQGWQQEIINPKILTKSKDLDEFEESCLSLWEEVKVKVKRPQTITATRTRRDWDIVTRELVGFEAKIFQHEYDHLIWKLIIDYK